MTKHDKPVVTLETSMGDVQIELWPELAPNHVANLITLAQKGYYDGLIFHRVIPGFMVQTGCPQGSGSGGPGYRIAAEFNPTEFKKGVLGMARTQDPNSGGSQFFICVADASFLTGEYTAFGRVIEGQSVADSISKAPRNSQDRPHDEISIRKIQVTLPAGYEVPQVAKYGK